MLKNTSWGKAADWYESLLSDKSSYQSNLILPNLLRLLAIKKGEVILDLGCGTGFFSSEFAKLGAKVIGVDIAKELIVIAKKGQRGGVEYFTASADKLPFVKDSSADAAVLILAIQNMENLNGVLNEAKRALRPNGRLIMVLSHPAFRVPKYSSWGWDSTQGIQYRRIDRYLSESKNKIQMHPGDKPSEYTLTFHRPLQTYFKALEKNGFLVKRLEEWNSNRKSEKGPRAEAEDLARKEIPLFLYLESVKIT